MQENKNFSVEEQLDSIERMYPPSYVTIYPHVHKITNQLSDSQVDSITEHQVDSYAEEVYNYFSNNPKINSNFLFKELIKILILRELFERYRQRRFFHSSVSPEDFDSAQSASGNSEHVKPQKPENMQIDDNILERFFSPESVNVNSEPVFTYNDSAPEDKNADSLHINETDNSINEVEQSFDDESPDDEFKGWY